MDPAVFVDRTLPGGFRIVRFVARGGFAWVYEAVGPDGLRCAVKIPFHDAQDARKRFIREIKILQELPPNPHCVAYVGDGLVDGLPFLAMEFVDGITLTTALERRPVWEPIDACELVRQMCLAYAGQHQLGLANRDVKPDNIMVTRAMQVKVLDFGLVKDAQGLLHLFEKEDILSGRDFAENLDRGVLAGSPEYMAPEQFADSHLEDPSQAQTDTWTDVYSLGLIFYQLLTGRKLFPFEAPADNDPRRYAQALLGYVRDRLGVKDTNITRPPEIDPELWVVLERALRTSPRRRYRTAIEVERDLAQYLVMGEVFAHPDEATFVADLSMLMPDHPVAARAHGVHPNPARKSVWAPAGPSATNLAGSRWAEPARNQMTHEPSRIPRDPRLPYAATARVPVFDDPDDPMDEVPTRISDPNLMERLAVAQEQARASSHPPAASLNTGSAPATLQRPPEIELPEIELPDIELPMIEQPTDPYRAMDRPAKDEGTGRRSFSPPAIARVLPAAQPRHHHADEKHSPAAGWWIFIVVACAIAITAVVYYALAL